MPRDSYVSAHGRTNLAERASAGFYDWYGYKPQAKKILLVIYIAVSKCGHTNCTNETTTVFNVCSNLHNFLHVT